MAEPIVILRDLSRGQQWLSDVLEKKYTDMTTGCADCGNDIANCLHRVVRALKFRTDLGIFDDTTDKLHSDLMELMGPIILPAGPIVDAGPAIQTQEPTNSAFLNGSVTEGDAPIVSIEWIQVSGPSDATIVDPSSPQTTVSDLVVGTYVFRLTAVDDSGIQGYDETVVTVKAATMSAYYGYTTDGSIPDQATILASPSVLISGNSFVIPFTDNGSPRWSWVAYPLGYPVMNEWADVSDPMNNGNIGDVTDLFGPYSTVGNMRVTATQYPTQLRNTLFEE